MLLESCLKILPSLIQTKIREHLTPSANQVDLKNPKNSKRIQKIFGKTRNCLKINQLNKFICIKPKHCMKNAKKKQDMYYKQITPQ